MQLCHTVLTVTETGVRLFNDIVAMTVSCQTISCVRRQASDPWLTLTTVGESGDGTLPEPLPDVGSSVM